MKFIEDIFNKLRPDFEKGGKFEFFYPLFEAKETFLFIPAHRTKSGSHVRDAMDSKRLMSTVIVALIPPLLMGIFNVGYQYLKAAGQPVEFVPAMLIGLRYVLPIIIVSYAVGGIWELIFAVTRKHEINEGFLVTGLLFPLTLPPTIPLWQVAAGISFGVVIGKEVFGGTGMNVFNPALIGRAFLFFAYPAQISGDKVWTVAGEKLVDGFSGATPLLVASNHQNDSVITAVKNFGSGVGTTDFSLPNMFIGLIPGSIGETSTLACLIGCVILIATGIGSWTIMASVALGGLAMTLGLNALAPNEASFLALPFHYHFVTGGFVFGLAYMATDPVSAAATGIGKWIYGFLIGAIAIIIRTLNPAYPEGMMLAILFMNAFAPLIDYLVIQKHIAWRMNRAKA